MHVCHFLGELEVDIDKLFLSKMIHNLVNFGKENISLAAILEVVGKF